jgi:hypothetical protein
MINTHLSSTLLRTDTAATYLNAHKHWRACAPVDPAPKVIYAPESCFAESRVETGSQAAAVFVPWSARVDAALVSAEYGSSPRPSAAVGPTHTPARESLPLSIINGSPPHHSERPVMHCCHGRPAEFAPAAMALVRPE